VSKSQRNPIEVLLLDHHAMMRDGLRLVLENYVGVKVIGEAGTSERALELAGQLNPDIILLELNLDAELNTDIITELLNASGKSKIILVTGIDDVNIHHLSLQMGTMGVVLKEQRGAVLCKAIEKVYAGEVWIDRVMMASVLRRMSRARLKEQQDPEAAKIASISERESEVIALVGEGLKNKEIASRLSISEVTVRHHLTSIYSKLEVSDRLELTIYSYRNGLAELPF